MTTAVHTCLTSSHSVNRFFKELFSENSGIKFCDFLGFQNKQGGPVQSGSDLACNFDSPCCWQNLSPPDDQLEWQKVSGSIDSSKLQQNFGTSNGPSLLNHRRSFS